MREAEKLFLCPIDITRRQATCPGSCEVRPNWRSWHLVRRTIQAMTLLTEVYGRFTEGFETQDLVKAKTLLEAWR
jgi:hypothetical protein